MIPPSLISPLAVNVSEFQTVNGSWTPFDIHPSALALFLDGVQVDQGLWQSNKTISFLVPNLGVGTHNITLVVYDSSGNLVSDTIVVNITAVSTPVTSTTSRSSNKTSTFPTQSTFHSSPPPSAYSFEDDDTEIADIPYILGYNLVGLAGEGGSAHLPN